MIGNRPVVGIDGGDGTGIARWEIPGQEPVQLAEGRFGGAVGPGALSREVKVVAGLPVVPEVLGGNRQGFEGHGPQETGRIGGFQGPPVGERVLFGSDQGAAVEVTADDDRNAAADGVDGLQEVAVCRARCSGDDRLSI